MLKKQDNFLTVISSVTYCFVLFESTYKYFMLVTVLIGCLRKPFREKDTFDKLSEKLLTAKIVKELKKLVRLQEFL